MNTKEKRATVMLTGQRIFETTSFDTALWNLSIHLVHEMGLKVYGGFPRDTVIRGITHWNEDIDVDIIDKDIDTIMDNINAWCDTNDCTIKRTKLLHPSGIVRETVIRTPDDEDMRLQLVRVKAVSRFSRGVDFDVNALHINAGRIEMTDIAKATMCERNTLAIVDNILNKRFRQMKTGSNVRDAIKMNKRRMKMVSRGWELAQA